jgi:transcriptional regulator with XRE-family HTH domain
MQKFPKSLFGQRLRAAREAANVPQDKLGVAIGLDEGCSSARISRYETGMHQPPFETAELLAEALGVPTAFFYCRSDLLAEIIVLAASFNNDELRKLKRSAERIRQSMK